MSVPESSTLPTSPGSKPPRRSRRRISALLVLLALTTGMLWFVLQPGPDEADFHGRVLTGYVGPKWVESIVKSLPGAAGRTLFREYTVMFTMPDNKDADLAGLAKMRHLVGVAISNTQITDAGLAHLSDCDDLRTVSLVSCPHLSDAGLQHLLSLRGLTQLDLIATPITDNGLQTVAELTQVQSLNLDSTRITDAGLARLAGLQSLTQLGLRDTAISDAGLAHLSGLTSLYSLNLANTRIRGTGLEQLAALSELESLSLSRSDMYGRCPQICGFAQGAAATRPVANGDHRCRPRASRGSRLTYLNLNQTQIGDTGLAHLAKLLITSLHLSLTKITDNGGFARPDAAGRSLVIVDTAVTVGGVAKLRAARPGLEIGY
ncbi:MAG: hypothetical protein U0992_16935 [Planctomycetaceae bacterium]